MWAGGIRGSSRYKNPKLKHGMPQWKNGVSIRRRGNLLGEHAIFLLATWSASGVWVYVHFVFGEVSDEESHRYGGRDWAECRFSISLVIFMGKIS